MESNLRPKSEKELIAQFNRLYSYYKGIGNRKRMGMAHTAFHNSFIGRKMNPFDKDKERKIGTGKFENS